MASVIATIRVNDPIGLHSRPAGLIVRAVNQAGLVVRIAKLGQDFVPANSPLLLMALKAKTGDELSLEIESDDLVAAQNLIADLKKILGGTE